MFCYQCEQTAKGTGCEKAGVCGKDHETSSLQDLLVYALKGLSQVAVEGAKAGVSDAAVNEFTVGALFATLTNVNFDPQRIADLINQCVSIREGLKEKHPDAELVFLVGGDSLIDIHSWHEPRTLVNVLDGIGIMCRPGEEIELRQLEAHTPGISEKLLFIDAPLLEISSSEIRRRVRSGVSYRYYLPPAVYELVVEHGLYRN